MKRLIFILLISCTCSLLVAQTNGSDKEQINAETERIHLEKIEVGKSLKRNQLEDFKSTVEENLEREKEKLEGIQQFQIGRSSEAKRKQVSEQTMVIVEMERYINTLEKEIAKTALFKSFSFQDTPEGVIEHILYAADSADFTKLKFLVDPYGEFDSGVVRFMLIETAPKESQDAFVRDFENARIIGESVIEENEAEIEVAIGPSSNRIVKMNLVKRKDRWYLLSF